MRNTICFAPGDRVAIGVSGGKDSMLLLKALSLYRYVRHGDFSLQAITLTSGKEKPDTSALEAYAAEVGVPIHIEHTDIYEILFDIRKDKHPCALCAKMRRSILCQRAQAAGLQQAGAGPQPGGRAGDLPDEPDLRGAGCTPSTPRP